MTEALAAWAAEAQLVGRGVLRIPDVVANAGASSAARRNSASVLRPARRHRWSGVATD